MKKSIFHKIMATALSMAMVLATMMPFHLAQASTGTYLYQDSFETAFTGIPAGWYAYAEASNKNVALDTTNRTQGSNSVRLTDSFDTSGVGILSSLIAVEEGKEYQGSVDAYAHSGKGAAYLLLYDTAGNVIASTKQETAKTAAWETLTLDIVAPTGTASAAILLYIEKETKAQVSYDNALLSFGSAIGLSASGNLAYYRNGETDMKYGNGQWGWQKALDGVSTTYLQAYQNYNQHSGYLKIDLGAVANINRVIAYEYTNKIKQFNIEVSSDNQNWSVVSYQTTMGNKKIIDFPTVQARYVKVQVNEADLGFGFYEIEVFNTSELTTFPNGAPDAPPVPTVPEAEVATNLSYEDENFHIYLFLGQSNMVGGDEILWEDRVRTEGAYLLNSIGDWEYAQAGPEDMTGYNRYANTTISNSDPTLGIAGMSPAHSFTMALAPYMAEDVGIGIICQSVSGTSIDQWQKGSGDRLYESAVFRTKEAIEKHGGVLKGIIWSQGEACAEKSDYLTKLNTMVTSMREELGVSAEDVPFISISHHPAKYIHNANVANGVNVIENYDYTSPASTETFEGVHFDADSQRLRGVRAAEKILNKIYGITKTEQELYQTAFGVDAPVYEEVPIVSAEPFTKGDGTASNPYEVSTIGQLYNVRNYPSAYFKQVNDIKEPLSEGMDTFKGNYDGQGYSINLQISKILEGIETGFIRELQAPGVVKNLVITGSISANLSVGGVAAICLENTSIISCKNYATIQGGSRTGGITGSTTKTTTLYGCENYGTVNGGAYTAGIVGVSYVPNLTNCANYGNINGVQQVGGVVGHSYGATMSECFNAGNVTGTNATLPLVGGLVGAIYGTQISNCYNLGTVTGTDAGGIGAYYRGVGGQIVNCYSTATVPMYTEVMGEITNPAANCYQLAEATPADALEGVTYLNRTGMMGLTAAQLGDSAGTVWNSSQTAFPTLKNTAQSKNIPIRQIQITKNGNGYTNPSSLAWVRDGETLTLDIEPALGGIVESVKVNGVTIGSVIAGKQSLCIPPITADTTIEVDFQEPTIGIIPINTQGTHTITFHETAESYNLYLYRGTTRPATPTITGVKSGADITSYLTEAELYTAVLAAVEDGTETLYSAPATINALFLYGDGSSENPYRVKTLGHLNNVRQYPDRYFVQVADITEGFTTPIPEFSGNYDGQNHKITLAIDTTAAAGFIVSMKAPGTLKNIITTGSVKTTNGSVFSGALLGSSPYASAVTVMNCKNYATVTSPSRVGGLIGSAPHNATVTNCENHGTVTGGAYTGGVFGIAGSPLISKCANYGSITGSSSVGGVAGQMNTVKTISEVYNFGEVTAKSTAAGIAGELIYGSLANVYNHGVINGTTKAGITNSMSKAIDSSLSNAYNTYADAPLYQDLGANGFAVSNTYQLSAEKAGTENGVTYTGLSAIKGLTAAQLGDTGGTVWNATGTYFPTLKNQPEAKTYKLWEVSFRSEGNGSLSQNKVLWVKDGETVSVTVTPATGETVEKITVNGVAAEGIGTGEQTFTISSITKDTEVVVDFSGTLFPVNVNNTDGVYTVLFENAAADSYNLYVYTGAARPTIPTITNVTSGTDISAYITEATVYNVLVSMVKGETEYFTSPIEVDAFFLAGDGSKENPYQIKTIGHLKNVATAPDKHYIQVADIEEAVTEPVVNTFTGTYDGNGKYLTLDLTSAGANTMNHYGLFRELNGATVKNLTLKGTIFYIGTYVGALAGAVTGASSSSPTVTTITNCVSEVNNTMPNTNYVGGLIGGQPTLNVSKIVFENCANKGNFGTATSGQGYWVGGLLGRGDGYVTINNCVNMGNLYIPTGDSVGGLVGWGYGTIKNSYNLGNVTAKTKASGGTGIFRGSVATENFYNLGTITALNANGYASAFANQPWGATASAKNSYNAGEIVSPMKGSYHTLVAVESASVKATYTNCYALTIDAAADGLSGISGVTAVTPATLKTAALGTGFEAADANDAYPYPQIKNNLQDLAWDFAKLTVSAIGNGSSSYAGSKYVKQGSTMTLTLTPASGYTVGRITYDGNDVFVNAEGNYTTPAINKDVTVAVTFVEQGLTETALTAVPTAYIPVEKNGSITFGTITLGYGAVVKEYGVVYSATQTLPEVGTGDAITLKANSAKAPLNAKNQFGIYLLGNGLAGKSYYTRPYVIYTDATGEHTVYGNAVPVDLK